jgi:hypothetical protein
VARAADRTGQRTVGALLTENAAPFGSTRTVVLPTGVSKGGRQDLAAELIVELLTNCSCNRCVVALKTLFDPSAPGPGPRPPARVPGECGSGG